MYKAAAMLVVYAALVVVLGALAYASAPEGANKATALIVPVAIAVFALAFAVMALAIHKNRMLGMIGIHAGLVLPLLVALAVGHRAYKAQEATSAYAQAQAAWVERVDAEPAFATEENKAAHFEQRNAPDHDKAYLRNALVAISGVSLLTFVAMLAARPKPPARKPKPKPKSEPAEQSS